MTLQDKIDRFLAGERFAVVGASQNRSKYGNKVLRCYLQNDLEAVPINPRVEEIEGLPTVPDLASLAQTVDGISIITPPHVTEEIVEQAIEFGIKNIWMQPGAESAHAIQQAEAAGLNVIAGGACLLVVLRYRESE